MSYIEHKVCIVQNNFPLIRGDDKKNRQGASSFPFYRPFHGNEFAVEIFVKGNDKDPLNEVQTLVLGLHSVLQTSIMRRIDRSHIQHMGWYILNHLYIKSQDAAVA